jgi:alkylation response protein AidB-like acyl-CoA dehydrogenase
MNGVAARETSTTLPAMPARDKETPMTVHNLTEKEASVSQAARRVADDLAPVARTADSQGGYNESWWQAVHRLQGEGYPSMFIPSQYGGGGTGVFELLLVVEQLARVDGGLANILFHEACSVKTIMSATDELRRGYLQRMIDGSLSCIAITEPQAGSDLAAMSTVAEKTDSGYVINGEKEIASLAGVAEVFLVWAKTDMNAGTRGISAFLLGRETPGIEVSGPADTLGFRQLPSHHVWLKNVEVPASALLRGVDKG